jgi:hypothetical protein
MAADLQQREHQRGEFVAHRDRGEADARVGARRPLGGANFTRVRCDVLRGLHLAQQFAGVAANAVVVDFAQLDLAFRVDHEGTAQSQAFFFDQHVEVTRDCQSRIGNHRILDLLDRVRRVVPCLVGEVRIGRHAVDLHAELLKFGITIGQVAQFSRANKREVSRVKHDDRPLALQGFVGNGLKVAIVVSGCLERFDLAVDDRHLMRPLLVRG